MQPYKNNQNLIMLKNKVLIINGHQRYEGKSEGRLNATLANEAKSFLEENSFEIRETATEKNYIVQNELEKLVWADFFIFQCPVYWFSLPWITKKYFDEVWSAGYTTVTCTGDGRTREDPSRRYGSGGMMQDKQYMLSLTYNCPKNEFDCPEGFFDGMSLDEANISIHKIFQFCGVSPMQTYSIHDVHKSDFDLEKQLQVFRTVLSQNFLAN